MTDPTDELDQGNLQVRTSKSLLQLLDRHSASLQLKPGQVLFDQGDFDDRLYVLDDGLLEVSVLSESGRKLSLNQLQSGSVFGEIAIFDPGPRTTRIEALSKCELRAIGQAALIAEIVRDPELATEMLVLAGRRMRWMSRQIEDQVFLPPASRLAGKILYLSDGGSEVRKSQAQLADYVGVTREVVSKTLSDWRRNGLVELSRGRVILIDKSALEEISSVDFV